MNVRVAVIFWEFQLNWRGISLLFHIFFSYNPLPLSQSSLFTHILTVSTTLLSLLKSL